MPDKTPEINIPPMPEASPPEKSLSAEEMAAQRTATYALLRLIFSGTITLFLIIISALLFASEKFPHAAFLSLLPPEIFSRTGSYINGALSFLIIILNAPLYRQGLSHLWRAIPNVQSFISLSTLAAFIYSVAALLLTDPDLVSHAPATYFLPLAITLTLTAMSDYIIATANKANMLALKEINAFSHAPTPPLTKATTTGHIALLSCLLALFSGLIWASVESLSVGITVFFTILIASCPGSIALAETLNLWSVTKNAHRHGIIIRGKSAIETAADVNAVAFSKTGILTYGQPHITDVASEGLTAGTLIGLAASAEADSYHPLAEALANRAIRERAHLQRLAAFNELPGNGVESLLNGTLVRVGNRRWLEAEHIHINATLITKADQLEERGKTVLFVSGGNSVKGLIAFEDEVRSEIPSFLNALNNMSIKTILLTGDSPRTAKIFARELQISEVHAGIPNKEKPKELQLLQAHGCIVALLDNGRNDATIAKQADLAIISASGKEENKLAAGFILIQPELSSVPHVLSLCRQAMTFTRQNYIWTFSGTLLALPAATGLLYSFGGPLFTPSLAILATVPGVFSSVINALRLLRK